MKSISVKQTIKVLGILLILSIFIVISVSIYLNQKNIKDATIVNIAGKQRMLTQRITKNIYYLYNTRSHDFKEIDQAIDEFNYGLDTLKNGNSLLNISEAPTQEINNQISKVLVLWKTFEKNTNDFKTALLNNDIANLNYLLSYMYKSNNELLEEVDEIVTLYTMHIEEKTNFIKKFQYVSFAFLFVFALYSLIQLKQIESHAREFFEKYKKISSSEISNLEPMEISSEQEFVEIADGMNCFIDKVNSVITYSQSALEQSEVAANQLEALTKEFGNIIQDLENKPEIMKNIDMSEDIAIESSENLLKTTKQLNELKKQLDSLLKNCKN
ncbi:type IV pili methyl-accepting chemotaxis transducer N-terminal domain-containing protein [Sulfurimonas sp.]|uniref:type IV pili methyl-accepting chemotaxis transducer N-terminal domain-containing protein n=1 Tax=Sulfurimonas sp. TaxID=2022749 RepID=UPI003563D3DE